MPTEKPPQPQRPAPQKPSKPFRFKDFAMI